MVPKKEKQVVMTYKYKMYRSKSLRHLDRLIDYHCEVYNYCIALHRRYYKMYHKHLSANKLKVHLTKVRKLFNSLGQVCFHGYLSLLQAGHNSLW